MSKGFEVSAIFQGKPCQVCGAPQRGASLVIVMIILTIVSILGIAGIQVSSMSEHGARNDRDQQIAWQSAEAALMDAEFDMFGPVSSKRRAIFFPETNDAAFFDGCGSAGAGASLGLCSLAETGKPAWLTVPFDATGAAAQSAEFGEFTGRTFAAGSAGIQPSKKPRYVIEAIPDQFGKGSSSRDLSSTDTKYVFRVTAIGFGPREDIQALVQMVYRN